MIRAPGGAAWPIRKGATYASMSKAVQKTAALTIAVGALGVAIGQVQAASEVLVGGSYHDEAFLAAQRDLMREPADSGSQVTVGGIRISVGTGETSAVTGFTPRFAGLGRGTRVAGAEADRGSELKARFGVAQEPPVRRELRIGPEASTEIAGLEIGWAAIAGLENSPQPQADSTSGFVLGGEMAVSGFRFDATFGQEQDLLGLEGNRVTAGFGYDFGRLDARVSYSLVETDMPEDTGVLALGSQLTLRPGLTLRGDVAYSDDGESGLGTTAGRVGVRLNF